MVKTITELETELQNCRAQIEKLKSENDELAGNLHLVNEKLRDSERLKGHFISNITNEIINPFASVLALSASIRQLSGDEIAKAHRMAELIFDEAFHLDFQLKNIFAAAIIEAGNDELKISGFNLKDVLQQILQYFSKQLQDKKITIKVDFENCPDQLGDFVFTSDREKLEMVLKNLISNSIKFNPEGSSIELVICCSNRSLSVEVSDHGKGIQPEDRKVIFDRFKQLDERINSINTGHGLGLSIVKAYTDLLGGDLRFADNYKGGTRVVVTIPESNNPDDWDDLEGFLLDTETSY
jgi:signal transduction histidine kinase